jgi:hypothetical protein
MSHFKEQEINFGTIKQKSSKTLTFNAEIQIPKISDIQVACGCTKVKWNEVDRTLTVDYKAGNIPNQVVGDQAVNKEVEVFYRDGTSETLTIKGFKTR